MDSFQQFFHGFFLLLLSSLVPVDVDGDEVDDGKLEEGRKDAKEANENENVQRRQISNLSKQYSVSNTSPYPLYCSISK